MSRIRPPRKPKNEPAGVTIANQANEIRTLIARVEKLSFDRADMELKISFLSAKADSHNAAARDIYESHTRLLGWQDCAREMLAKYGPL